VKFACVVVGLRLVIAMKMICYVALMMAVVAPAAAACKFSKVTAPTANPPHSYVKEKGKGLDAYSFNSRYLAKFDIGTPVGILKTATLRMSVFDVDNAEDDSITVDGEHVGNMEKGGNNCWSVSEFDVTAVVKAFRPQLAVYVEMERGWANNVDWVELDLYYNPIFNGDPHFRTWSGEKYDFHGVCDLVLLHNAEMDMDVHIRTKRTRMWSYVSAAALRIGRDTLEVAGGTENNYWINGKKGPEVTPSTTLPTFVSGHPVQFKQVSSKSREFILDVSDAIKITIRTWNGYVSLKFKGASEETFGQSVGLLGAFPHGTKLSRDNSTVMEDLNAFGQEWQVLPTEPKLFHNVEGPQAPEKCEVPSSVQMRRRLGESLISKEDAEVACSRVHEDDFDLCVFDVMATNDKEAVGAY
jgi:hypothetical protein